MNDIHALLFKKSSSDSWINSYSQWNIVCINPPLKAGGKTKELPKRNWYDEQGDDTYIPSALKFEGYDTEFEFAYKGQELATNPFDLSLAFTQINAFKRWLAGLDDSVAEMKIYSPFTTIGRQGCYLLEISDEAPHVQTKQEAGNLYHENVVTFKVKFRVTDPLTNITLS